MDQPETVSAAGGRSLTGVWDDREYYVNWGEEAAIRGRKTKNFNNM